MLVVLLVPSTVDFLASNIRFLSGYVGVQKNCMMLFWNHFSQPDHLLYVFTKLHSFFGLFWHGHLTSLEGFSFLPVLSDCIIQMQTSKPLWKAKGENGAE